MPKTTEEYNALYDASKAVTTSPLTQKSSKDIERGKKMYEHTCTACHG
jgi:cytochrome c